MLQRGWSHAGRWHATCGTTCWVSRSRTSSLCVSTQALSLRLSAASSATGCRSFSWLASTQPTSWARWTIVLEEVFHCSCDCYLVILHERGSIDHKKLNSIIFTEFSRQVFMVLEFKTIWLQHTFKLTTLLKCYQKRVITSWPRSARTNLFVETTAIDSIALVSASKSQLPFAFVTISRLLLLSITKFSGQNFWLIQN